MSAAALTDPHNWAPGHHPHFFSPSPTSFTPSSLLPPPHTGQDLWPYRTSPPPELAPGWFDLMVRCWDHDPAARPRFTVVVSELHDMFLVVKEDRKRAAAAAVAARGGRGGRRAGARPGSSGGEDFYA